MRKEHHDALDNGVTHWKRSCDKQSKRRPSPIVSGEWSCFFQARKLFFANLPKWIERVKSPILFEEYAPAIDHAYGMARLEWLRPLVAG